jgi:hypothetical protein
LNYIICLLFSKIGYVPLHTEDDEEEEEVLMPPEDDENSNEAPGYPPLHPDDDEDGIDIGFHFFQLYTFYIKFISKVFFK